MNMRLICSAFLRFVDKLLSCICSKAPSPVECKGSILKAAVNLGFTLDLYGQQAAALVLQDAAFALCSIYLQIRLNAAEPCAQAGENFSV